MRAKTRTDPRAAIKPPKAKLRKWAEMTDSNDHSGVLADMSEWLARELATRPMLANECERLHRIFAAIAEIHDAERAIPQAIYGYRYARMNDLLALAGAISADLKRAFNSCL